MVTREQAFLERLLATFAAEAEEHLDALSKGLLEFEKTPAGSKRLAILEAIFREVHSLKGAARAVDRTDIGAVCQPLESALSALKSGDRELNPGLLNLLHEAASGLRQLLAEKAAGTPPGGLVQRLEDAAAGRVAAKAKPPRTVPGRRGRSRRAHGGSTAAADSGRRAEGEPKPTAIRAAQAGTIRISTAKVDALFRQAEEMISFKLSSEQRSAEINSIAGELGARRDVLTRIHSLLLSSAPKQAPANGGGAAADMMAWVNRFAEEIEAEIVSAGAGQERLESLTMVFEADRRALAKSVDGLLEDAKKLLMQPLASLLEVIPRLAGELAREQGKELDISTQGEEIEIDRRIQEDLKDPLIHLVRNSVDHGIEKPDSRVAAGKPRRGTITITAAQFDVGKAEIVIADDGAGIDLDRVRNAALKLGATTAQELAELGEEAVAMLVFRSGVSTSGIVTDVSGRGLGLAIVQEKIERLGGSISLESRPGAGTTFRILVPVTLAVLRGVVIDVAGIFFVIPTAAVERVARVRRMDVKSVENRDTIHLNGHTLSVVRLADVLEMQRPATAGEKSDLHLVVLASAGERIALVVGKVHGEQEILLKSLGDRISRARNISGVTTLRGGALAPVLNVPDLLHSCRSVSSSPKAPAVVAPVAAGTKSILVVEDSITARTLLKNILEASGYRVRTAVDGIDALTTLKSEEFAMVISDVEMPRMNGFDLTMRIRANQKLTELPVILVTALATREHRERGIDAGANAYIVKSSFDQAGLLETVRRLIGR